jgi:hypothetical protein
MAHLFYDVAAAKTINRHISLHHDFYIEVALHSVLRLSELSVANFMGPDKYSVIQTQPMIRL